MGIGRTAWRGGRRRWVWLAAGVVVVVLLAAGLARALTAGAGAGPAAAATVAADRGAVTSEVATTGNVQPAQTRSLSFAVAGTVEAVKVRPGTVVTAGQELARIDDSDAAGAVDSARKALADAEDALQEARDQAAPTGSGCGVVPAAYASAPPPTPTGATPAPTRTTAPAATPRPTRTPAPTRTSAPARTSPPARGGAPTTTACGGADQQGGRQGGGGDAVLSAEQRVNQAGAAVAKAEDDLEGTTITAPLAGRVLSVSGKVGSRVGAGAAFLTLADVSGMQIAADFPEADADRLAVRQKAAVTLADRAGETFAATVVQVDPVGTSDGTLVRFGVVLSFDDAPEDLLVGQSAAVRVTTGAKRDVLRVPSTAVHDVAGPAGTVLRAGARVRVGVGLRGDAYTEITSGLAPGDTVARSW
ncbi:efflux RND transporter periplasmic adaptor subunit [Nucisporomicrobium flavum]|uniref:efflux RND transporter periplasmic adaptor subunit n=1 Tax=Nucisporomicrobium flavum TaxID=2785915 RepID=UPI0018F6DA2C|nr:efflux RND transporter periplasmic adaptor subunit [Nucisporomicrobium flavum]